MKRDAIIETRVRPEALDTLRLVHRCEWRDCEYGQASHAVECYINPERVQQAFASMSRDVASSVLWQELVEEQVKGGPYLYRTRYLCMLHAARSLGDAYDNLAFAGTILHPDRKDTTIFFRRLGDQYQSRYVFLPMQPIEAARALIEADPQGDFVFK